METNRIFTNWKQRCSGLGHIMTNLESITQSQLNKLAEFDKRVIDSLSDPKKALTDKMKEEYAMLKAKRDAPDELPSGAKTHLDNVFRSRFWKRPALEMDNKYLDKGKNNQEDVMELHSRVDEEFYSSNKKRFSNDYIEGEPDNFDDPLITEFIKVRDAKANFGLESFESAELISLYAFQIKGYSWLLKEEFNLPYLPQGELCYGLTNSPLHIIQNEMNSMFYKFGRPDDDNEKWVETKRLIERRNIFDIAKFKKEYPHYIFENEYLDFDIPYWMRVKKFDVEVTEEDVTAIKSRVMLSRIYLVQKEIETLKKMKQI